MEMEWSRSWGGRRSLEGKKLWRPSSLVCPRHDSDTDSAVEEVPRGEKSPRSKTFRFRQSDRKLSVCYHDESIPHQQGADLLGSLLN